MQEPRQTPPEHQIGLELLGNEPVVPIDLVRTGVSENPRRPEHGPDGEHGALNAQIAAVDVRRRDYRGCAGGDPNVRTPGGPDDEETLLGARGDRKRLPVVELGERTDAGENGYRLTRPLND